MKSNSDSKLADIFSKGVNEGAIEELRITDFATSPKTEFLYWVDSYMTSFTADVLRFEPDKKKHAYLVLDRTAFHPKSGGQPSDKGRITNESGELTVQKAMLVDGVVVHWGKMSLGDSLEGQVLGELDRDWRYLVMRRHTAGHLLDHCIEFVTKTKVETTDSWLGDPCWIGYFGVPPSREQVKEIEAVANQRIREGRAVVIDKVSREELMRIAQNAPNIARLPNDVELRLVTIEGQGPIPCGGTHVKDISEIGEISISKVETVDQGYRIHYELSVPSILR